MRNKFHRQPVTAFLSLLAWLPVFLSSNIAIANTNADRVTQAPGLVAFWDFQTSQNDLWTSRYDPLIINRSFPVYLRRIGDTSSYHISNWPYTDTNSRLTYDETGPFGRAVRFNRGYVYGAIPRNLFDQSLLDINGTAAFTLIAWVKFTGQRHLVAGIWDEGGWSKYAGERQAALFSGIMGSRGVVAHVSANGAASYPQSTISGAQYARDRAIDGAVFPDNAWVMMAMTFNPASRQVIASYNGRATPKVLTDPVADDVFHYTSAQPCNPFTFDWPIYSPRSFIIKYNGYSFLSGNVFEHWIAFDLRDGSLTYDRSVNTPPTPHNPFRIHFDIFSPGGATILSAPVIDSTIKSRVTFTPIRSPGAGDTIVTSLDEYSAGAWHQVGSAVKRGIGTGAAFSFGRAQGLGATEGMTTGSELYMAGVAVFSRVLTDNELLALSFSTTPVVSHIRMPEHRAILSKKGPVDLLGRQVKDVAKKRPIMKTQPNQIRIR